jgi:hypothetical protein
MVQVHAVKKGVIIGSAITVAYALVFDIAWWMFVRRKPALKKWAIAANAICILIYFPPAIIYWNWRGFLAGELELWPVILIGVFGIIIFNIPYSGWRQEQTI